MRVYAAAQCQSSMTHMNPYEILETRGEKERRPPSTLLIRAH